VKEHCLRHTEA